MHKYRKKPVVIEAFQMTAQRKWDNSEWPNWLHEAWQKEYCTPGSLYRNPRGRMLIGTLEGSLEVSNDDWIIRGVQGEIYPCKPDIFAATYEKAED
jgi:hypothetical protein